MVKKPEAGCQTIGCWPWDTYCIKGEKGGPHNSRGHWEWGKDIIFQHTLNEANTKRLTPNPKHKSALLTVYTHQALPHLSVLMTLCPQFPPGVLPGRVSRNSTPTRYWTTSQFFTSLPKLSWKAMRLGRRGVKENEQLNKTIKKKKRQREQCNNYHYFPWTSLYSALRTELTLNCNLVMFSSMSPDPVQCRCIFCRKQQTQKLKTLFLKMNSHQNCWTQQHYWVNNCVLSGWVGSVEIIGSIPCKALWKISLSIPLLPPCFAYLKKKSHVFHQPNYKADTEMLQSILHLQ